MIIQQKLEKIIKRNNSLLCVGLDSDFKNLPAKFIKKKNPQFGFNKWIIEQTHDLVCAYKPNSAFYEVQGVQGIRELKMTIEYLQRNYPEIVTILDAKRGDIGSTNEKYAASIFDWFGFDGVTLFPYLGREALKPFLERKDKGIFVLCRTSNPGAGEFQDLLINGEPLYKLVARRVVNNWNRRGNCMLVVGATYPDELAKVRKIAGEMTFLIPGIGPQRGEVEKTVITGQNTKGKGMIINSSRGVIFAQNPRKEAEKLRDLINKFRKTG